MAESFFATLKNERVHRTQYPTRALPLSFQAYVSWCPVSG
jgi:hypothetical protein